MGDLDVLLYAALAAWLLFELALVGRDLARGTGRRARDRGTRELLSLSLNGAILLAVVALVAVPSLATPDAYRAVGMAIVWLGLGIRVWAVLTLGRSFRTSVEVDHGQAVVRTGPYRWVRHPSYTGLLLILAGFGLAIGNWLSLAICLTLPLPAHLRRIRVEEEEMVRVLGDPYRAYRESTRRLLPGVW